MLIYFNNQASAQGRKINLILMGMEISKVPPLAFLVDAIFCAPSAEFEYELFTQSREQPPCIRKLE